MDKLNIIIVNYNTREITLNCLKSIFNQHQIYPIKVWLVDNASSDTSVGAIKKYFPQVKIIRSKQNIGFAAGNNLAIRRVYKNSEYIMLLNTDTVLEKEVIDKLLLEAEKEDYDILSSKLISPDGTLQPNAGGLPQSLSIFFWISGLDDIFGKIIRLPSYQERNINFYKGTKKVGWVSATAILIKSEIFRKIGFLDEKIFMYGEDVDFCLRASKANFKIGWSDVGRVIHLGGASSEKAKYSQWKGEFKGLLYLFKKHYGRIPSLFLRCLFYIFIPLRIIAFLTIGKKDYAKTYAKILVEI